MRGFLVSESVSGFRFRVDFFRVRVSSSGFVVLGLWLLQHGRRGSRKRRASRICGLGFQVQGSGSRVYPQPWTLKLGVSSFGVEVKFPLNRNVWGSGLLKRDRGLVLAPAHRCCLQGIVRLFEACGVKV